MTDNKFKAVFFDAEHTLFCTRVSRPQVYLDAAIEHGATDISRELVASEISRATSAFEDTIDGNLRFSHSWWLAYNTSIFSALGLASKAAVRASKSIDAYYSKADAYQVYPETIEILKVLSATGIQIGVLANWAEDLPALCKRLKIQKHFGFIISSSELRALKPDRAVFDRILFRCGVAAEHALHVGADFERDVCGALNAGMNAALIDRSDNLDNELHEGVRVINSLHDVLDICELTAHGI